MLETNPSTSTMQDSTSLHKTRGGYKSKEKKTIRYNRHPLYDGSFRGVGLNRRKFSENNK